MKRVWNVLIAALIGGLIAASIVGAFMAMAVLTEVVGPEAVILGSMAVLVINLVINLALLFTDWGKRDFRGRQ